MPMTGFDCGYLVSKALPTAPQPLSYKLRSPSSQK